MFVYLFVWETLGVLRHQRETSRNTRGRPAGDQQEHQRETNELKSKLVHMSLIETPAGAPETPQGDLRHQQEHQRKARCNYLKIIWNFIDIVCLVCYVSDNYFQIEYWSMCLGDQRHHRETREASRLCRGVQKWTYLEECLSMVWFM